MFTRVLPFFAVVVASTWLFQLPAILATRGVVAGPPERYFPLVALGFFGPTFAAVILARLEGRAALRAMFRPLAIWRVGPHWYLIALGLSSATFVAGALAYQLVTGSDAVALAYPPTQAQQLAAMAIIPFTEQIAWRAYALPRAEARMSPVAASVIVGAAWGLFHVQKHLFLDGTGRTLALAPVTIATMTAGTVVFTWLQRRANGSVLLVVIAHAGIYLNNPASALPANDSPMIVYAVALSVLAALVVLFDRRAWKLEATKSGDEAPSQSVPASLSDGAAAARLRGGSGSS